jgi:hypothetical protein
MTTTQEYRLELGGRRTTHPTPDVLARLSEWQVRATTTRVAWHKMTEPAPTLEDAEVAEIMAWLDSDSLDWDAVERARHDGW